MKVILLLFPVVINYIGFVFSGYSIIWDPIEFSSIRQTKPKYTEYIVRSGSADEYNEISTKLFSDLSRGYVVLVRGNASATNIINDEFPVNGCHEYARNPLVSGYQAELLYGDRDGEIDTLENWANRGVFWGTKNPLYFPIKDHVRSRQFDGCHPLSGSGLSDKSLLDHDNVEIPKGGNIRDIENNGAELFLKNLKDKIVPYYLFPSFNCPNIMTQSEIWFSGVGQPTKPHIDSHIEYTKSFQISGKRVWFFAPLPLYAAPTLRSHFSDKAGSCIMRMMNQTDYTKRDLPGRNMTRDAERGIANSHENLDSTAFSSDIFRETSKQSLDFTGKVLEVTVSEGDTVYFPPGLLHGVRSLVTCGVSISSQFPFPLPFVYWRENIRVIRFSGDMRNTWELLLQLSGLGMIKPSLKYYPFLLKVYKENETTGYTFEWESWNNVMNDSVAPQRANSVGIAETQSTNSIWKEKLAILLYDSWTSLIRVTENYTTELYLNPLLIFSISSGVDPLLSFYDRDQDGNVSFQEFLLTFSVWFDTEMEVLCMTPYEAKSLHYFPTSAIGNKIPEYETEMILKVGTKINS